MARIQTPVTTSCQTYELPYASYVKIDESLGFPKNSELQPAFSYFLKIFTESGVGYRIRTKWLTAYSDNCFRSSSISYNKTIFGFATVLAGIALAFILCAIEWFCYKRNKKESLP